MRFSSVLLFGVAAAAVSAGTTFAQTGQPSSAEPAGPPSSPALSQTSPAEPLTPDVTAPPNSAMQAAQPAVGEVVVTARRRSENLQDVPIAVTAISGDTIEQQGILQVKDVAAITPGLNINSDSVGRAFLSIRGIGTTLIDTVQPGVGIFIDGVYEPNTSYLNSPLLDVAQIEVLKGPQGTLFGNNTLGGAINVITRQPSDQFVGRATAAIAGPDDYGSGSISVSGPIIPGLLQMRLGAAYHTQNGFEQNTLVGGHADPLEQQEYNGTLRFLPTSWSIFSLNAYYSRVRGGNTPYEAVTGPTDYTLDATSNQNNIAVYKYSGANLKGEFNVDQLKTKVTATVAFDHRDNGGTGDADFGPIDFLRDSGVGSLSTTTGELRFDTKWSNSISTLVGVFADRSTYDQSSMTTIVPLMFTAPAAEDSFIDAQALFGTVFFQLTPTIEFTAGLRYDHQKTEASTAGTGGAYKAYQLEPRFSLKKRWTPHIMTYVSASRGFRGGGENGPGAPNLIYQGDSVWTYEAGSKFDAFNNRLTLDADVFYNDYNNFIGGNSLAPSTTGAGYVAVDLNTGHVESYGTELQGAYKITHQWTVDGGLTLLHARVTNDNEYIAVTGTPLATDRIPFTPDWNFNLDTNYTLPVGADAMVFDLGEVAKGDRKGASLSSTFSPTLHPYYLTNASIAYHHGPIELTVFADNIFDRPYIESYIDISTLERAGVPPPIANNLAVQGDRRRYGLRARYDF